MRRHHLPGDLKQLIFDTIRPMLEARNRSLAAKLACPIDPSGALWPFGGGRRDAQVWADQPPNSLRPTSCYGIRKYPDRYRAGCLSLSKRGDLHICSRLFFLFPEGFW